MSALWKPLSLLLLSGALAGRRHKKPETDIEKDLVIEEFKACKELIGKNIDIIERNEVYVIGACAAIIVFTIDKGDNPITIIAAFLPMILAIIGRNRYVALDGTISLIDSYIKKQEVKFKVIDYTNYYEMNRHKHKLGKSRRSVWNVLILSMLAFAVIRIYVAVNPLESFCEKHQQAKILCRQPEPPNNST